MGAWLDLDVSPADDQYPHSYLFSAATYIFARVCFPSGCSSGAELVFVESHFLIACLIIFQTQGGDSVPVKAPSKAVVSATKQVGAANRMFHVLLPVLLLILAVALNMYLSAKK